MKKGYKRVFSALLACLLIGGAVPLVARAEGEVCEIVGGAKYSSFYEAVIAAKDGQTIRLLCDYIEKKQIAINDKTVYLDAGEYSLYLDFTSFFQFGTPYTLTVNSGGFLQTSNGMGNVNLTRVSGSCLSADNGAKVEIRGDIIADLTGITATSGAQVTVGGTITAYTYIRLNNTDYTIDDFTPTTTKEGYLTYTDGDSTVWVLDPNYVPPEPEPEPEPDPCWGCLPCWVQWILRWVCFGWLWMK